MTPFTPNQIFMVEINGGVSHEQQSYIRKNAALKIRKRPQ